MKAVAIPYIIALIIGVIVVAVLAYWFISTGGKGSSVGDEAQCTSSKTYYCTTQNQDALDKVQKNCNIKDPKSIDWKNFCSFIPGWKETGK